MAQETLSGVDTSVLIDLHWRIGLGTPLSNCADGHWLQRWAGVRRGHLRDVTPREPRKSCRDMASAVTPLATAHADTALRANCVEVWETVPHQRL